MRTRSVPHIRPAVLTLGLVLGAAGCGSAQVEAAGSWRSMTSARQTQQEEALDVRVEYGAGRLEIRPADPGLLYEMELRYDEDQVAPLTDYDAERGLLRLGVRGRDGGGGIRAARGAHRESHAAIALSPEVPVSLRLEFGAGEADLDLGGLALRRLDVTTGASATRIRFSTANRADAERVEIEAGAASMEVEGLGNARAGRISYQGGAGRTVLDFGGEWTRSASATVEMGVGSLTLRLPREVGVRITRSSFLTRFSPAGMERRGDSYYSAGWEGAPHRLDLSIEAALGAVNVEWID